MRYRINQKTQDKISEIGLGSAYMPQTPLKEAIPALRRAYEGGINYYDLAAGDGKAFPMYGEAFADVRKTSCIRSTSVRTIPRAPTAGR